MHEHDFDLIAALADGSLDDQSEACALVETCQECRQEYATQVAILATLATIQPVTMSELEKAALHRDLWTELRTQPAKTAAPWWYRLSYAAAGLFVVVGLLAVVNQLGGSGDSGGPESFAEVASGLDEGASGETASPLSGDGSEESVATTVAAADAGADNTPDFKTLADETRLQQLPPSVRSNDSASADLDCVNAAGLENQEVVGTVDADRKYLIAVANDEDLDADTPVNFVDAATCEVAHVEE